MYACVYERLKFGYLFMCESLILQCLSKDLFCKFLRPLTVLIPNCIYRCDIIHPLVRYHGRSRRSPAPLFGPLGGPSGPLGCPSGPLGGPSGPLGGPSGPLGGSSGPLGGLSGPLGGPSGLLGGPSGPLSGPSGPFGGPSGPLGVPSGLLGGSAGRPNT